MMVQILKHWEVLYKIGCGSFGEIYLGQDIRPPYRKVAIKIESKDSKFPQLLDEYKVYRIVKDGVGVPQVLWCGSTSTCHVMVMELLGESLETLYNLCGRRFSLKTVTMLAIQLLHRIEHHHNNHFLHRDIKPDNFLMGLGENGHILYMIDMGLCKQYRDPVTLQHIPFREHKKLIGTPRYASINTHLGVEQCRRDDLESIGFMLVYFIQGRLPWQGLKARTKQEKYDKISSSKMNTTVEALCAGCHPAFATYLTYCRQLKFGQRPDYKYLRSIFYDLFRQQQFEDDCVYDWMLLERRPVRMCQPWHAYTLSPNNTNPDVTILPDGRRVITAPKGSSRYLAAIAATRPPLPEGFAWTEDDKIVPLVQLIQQYQQIQLLANNAANANSSTSGETTPRTANNAATANSSPHNGLTRSNPATPTGQRQTKIQSFFPAIPLTPSSLPASQLNALRNSQSSSSLLPGALSQSQSPSPSQLSHSQVAFSPAGSTSSSFGNNQVVRLQSDHLLQKQLDRDRFQFFRQDIPVCACANCVIPTSYVKNLPFNSYNCGLSKTAISEGNPPTEVVKCVVNNSNGTRTFAEVKDRNKFGNQTPSQFADGKTAATWANYHAMVKSTEFKGLSEFGPVSVPYAKLPADMVLPARAAVNPDVPAKSYPAGCYKDTHPSLYQNGLEISTGMTILGHLIPDPSQVTNHVQSQLALPAVHSTVPYPSDLYNAMGVYLPGTPLTDLQMNKLVFSNNNPKFKSHLEECVLASNIASHSNSHTVASRTQSPMITRSSWRAQSDGQTAKTSVASSSPPLVACSSPSTPTTAQTGVQQTQAVSSTATNNTSNPGITSLTLQDAVDMIPDAELCQIPALCTSVLTSPDVIKLHTPITNKTNSSSSSSANVPSQSYYLTPQDEKQQQQMNSSPLDMDKIKLPDNLPLEEPLRKPLLSLLHHLGSLGVHQVILTDPFIAEFKAIHSYYKDILGLQWADLFPSLTGPAVSRPTSAPSLEFPSEASTSSKQTSQLNTYSSSAKQSPYHFALPAGVYPFFVSQCECGVPHEDVACSAFHQAEAEHKTQMIANLGQLMMANLPSFSKSSNNFQEPSAPTFLGDGSKHSDGSSSSIDPLQESIGVTSTTAASTTTGTATRRTSKRQRDVYNNPYFASSLPKVVGAHELMPGRCGCDDCMSAFNQMLHNESAPEQPAKKRGATTRGRSKAALEGTF